MQARYYHELEHMRNASQRPSPSRSLDRSTPNPSSPSSSRNHTRTQSAITHIHEHVYSSPKLKTTYFNQNDGGWLESSPVQLSTSTSHSSPLQNSQHSDSASIEGCTKEILGTISNDDILKLTQLTNKLPVVSKKYNHIQKEHSHIRHRQHLEGNELLQQSDERSDISNDSRHIDTGFTNLLNQDFMRSSPVSETDYSALLTIPSCNPSTISTDTDNSQFSWHNTNNNNNKYSKQSPLLTKSSSDQTTASASTEKMRSYHPVTISTTASYTESDLTPSSSQNSHHSKRRSLYKSLMKRDKKGKAKYNYSTITKDNEPAVDTGYDTDEPPSNMHHTLQHEPAIMESNTEYHKLPSRIHPMVNTPTNYLIPSSSSGTPTRKRHENLSIHRFRLSTRRKLSSFGIQGSPSSDKTTTGQDRQPQRRQLYGRRHSFSNIREYDLHSHGTDSQLDTTTTASAGKKGKNHGRHTSNTIYLNNRDILTTGGTATATTSQISSTSLIASTTSLLSASSPPHIPSPNIPPPINSTANGNYSPRSSSSSTLALGTPKQDLSELEPDDYETGRSALDSSQHQLAIEITPAISQHQQQQEEGEDQLNHRNQPSQKILYFDYDSLPWDNIFGEPQGVKALVKRMIDNGYGTMTKIQIKFDADDDDDESDEEDEEGDDLDSKMDKGMEIIAEEGGGSDGDDHGDKVVDTKDSKDHDGTITPTVESSKVIGGEAYYSWVENRRISNVKAGTRLIAQIHVGAENDTGFYKLTQHAEETMLIKGRLLNLYVSFLVPHETDDDMASNLQENSTLDQNTNDRLLSLDPFIVDAKAFLKERAQQYRAFVPLDDFMNKTQQQQYPSGQFRASRKNSDSSNETGVRCANTSSSSLSSFSSIATILPSSTSKAQQSATKTPPLSSSHSNGSSTFLQSLWSCVPYQEYNAYEYRQEQLRDAISDLRRGMDDFKRSLKDTENMVHGVQIDMNDTKAKMDTYLKDVPETHYSELKRLEVSIESIVANRAKSRGMELLYWLLTALLTGCAFLLWAVICALKLGQTAISFPSKMIKIFNEHMEERNKVVKQAGMRIVAKGADRPPSVPSLDQPLSLSRAHSDTDADAPCTDVPARSNLRRSSSRRASTPK